ncbi:MAG: TonB-dependent receptor [Chromatiales bacterium]|nr:TonB-dependent receptor [Chromatiales bacterium]
MLPVCSRLNLCRVLLVVLAGVFAPGLSAATYAGRPVRAVLEELQRPGLTLIYNDILVPADLRVLAEPDAPSGIPLLNEILAPHGLTTRAAGPGIWAIVAAPGGKPTVADTPRPDAPRRPPTALEEIVVTASQYNLANTAPEVRTFLTQQELRSLPKMADETLRAVHRLPGAASNGVSGLAHMRGGDENETQIILDGMPLQEPFHLKSFFSPISVLDPGMVDSLNVYAGGFPVEYGGRMSAVVDARSVDPTGDGDNALGLSLYHLSALTGDTFANDRGRWLASARRSNLAEVVKVAERDLGEPRYLDAFVKAEFDLSDQTTVAAHALFAEDRIDINNNDQTEFARTTDRNVYLWATAERQWSDALLGRALVAWTTVDKNRKGTVDDPAGATGAVQDLRDSHTTLLKVDLEQGDDFLRWRAGFDAAWMGAEYAYRSTFQTTAGYPFPNSAAEAIVRDLAPEPEGTATGAFVAARWRITDTVTGELGLRWDNQTYDRVDRGTQLSPRANVLWDLSVETQVRASWGRFYQAQGIGELQVEDGIDTFFPAQRADHFIVSVEHALNDSISARFEAYYKDYEELKPRFENLFDPLVVLPELKTDRVGVAPTAGLVRGLEFLIRDRAADPWGWWLSYTWSRAEETVDRADVPRSWDQRHTFNGGLSWTRGPWDLSLAGTWHTGWPSTPATYVQEPDPVVTVGARNSTRYDDFRSLDIRAAYTFNLPDSELLTFLEITNLLAFRNPCCVEYRVIDDGAGGTVLDTDFDYWPRFVPNLGILWRF